MDETFWILELWNMNKGKHTQAKRNKVRQIQKKQNNNLTKEKIFITRIVHLSAIELTQSSLRPEDLDADIDAFVRRINLKEYHAPDNIDEIEQDSSYHCSVLEKLNKRDCQAYYRPSREPYLNSYVAKLR